MSQTKNSKAFYDFLEQQDQDNLDPMNYYKPYSGYSHSGSKMQKEKSIEPDTKTTDDIKDSIVEKIYVSFSDQLHQLQSTSSTKEKERLLTKWLSTKSTTSAVLYALFDLANNYSIKTFLTDFAVVEKELEYGGNLSQYCMYWLTAVTAPHGDDEKWNQYEKEIYDKSVNLFLNIYNQLKEGRKFLRNDWAKVLEELAKHSSKWEFSWYEKAITKDLTVGASTKIFNKACKANGLPEIEEYQCMKVSSLEDAEISYPAYVSEKKDGVNCTAIKENGIWNFYTRSGQTVYLPHLEESMIKLESIHPDFKIEEYVLFGELVSSSRQSSSGLANSAIKSREESKLPIRDLVLYTFDMITKTEYTVRNFITSFEDRLVLIKNFRVILNQDYPGLGFVDHALVESKEEVYARYDEFRSLDSEGVIVNDPQGLFEFARSKKRARIKAENTGDFEIIGWAPHKRRDDWIGSFEVKTRDGKVQCYVGSGLNEEQRATLYNQRESLQGKVIEIQYNNIIPDTQNEGRWTIFLPVFLRTREDKLEADSFDELKKI